MEIFDFLSFHRSKILIAHGFNPERDEIRNLSGLRSGSTLLIRITTAEVRDPSDLIGTTLLLKNEKKDKWSVAREDDSSNTVDVINKKLHA